MTILRNSLRISLKKARTGEESRSGEALSFLTRSPRFGTGGSHSVTGKGAHKAHRKQLQSGSIPPTLPGMQGCREKKRDCLGHKQGMALSSPWNFLSLVVWK